MGANIDNKEVIMKMDNIVDKVLNNFKSWDGILESGIKIIEDNEVYLNEFKTLDLHIKDKNISYDEKYLSKMNEIIYEHKKLTGALKIEQNQLIVLMQQLNKKDDVINSYISVKKDSVFIDKDIK